MLVMPFNFLRKRGTVFKMPLGNLARFRKPVSLESKLVKVYKFGNKEKINLAIDNLSVEESKKLIVSLRSHGTVDGKRDSLFIHEELMTEIAGRMYIKQAKINKAAKEK